jgi:hypothetical protein
MTLSPFQTPFLWQDEYYGGRVHELTGKCEGLKGNLSNIKADDEGYAYVQKVSSERVFLTPVGITRLSILIYWHKLNWIANLIFNLI